MSDLLSIGASGLSAYRAALSAVGDNVANSETPGFARRTVTIKEQATTQQMHPTYGAGIHFGGSQATAVTRAYDQFKDSEVRVATADAGRADAKARWLATAENAIDDSDAGAHNSVTAFYNAADTLAADPGGEMPRRAFLSALDNAAGAIRTSAEGLARTADGITKEAQSQVDAVNGSLDALAKVNVALRRATPGSSGAASLMDERDRLVDDISSRIGVSATYGDSGTVSLNLAGNSNAVLVSGPTVNPIGMAVGANGQLTLLARVGDVTQPVLAQGGALAGLSDVSTIVADRRASLNAIASGFATAVNDWSAGGLDKAGNPGQPLLTIGVAGASTLAIALADPAGVPAASADGQANGNLLALQAQRTGGSEDRLAQLVAGHAQATASAKAEASATGTRRDAALESRDTVTGIDLDREAAELLRFQQAYNGSAKVIQVARDTLQSILDLI